MSTAEKVREKTNCMGFMIGLSKQRGGGGLRCFKAVKFTRIMGLSVGSLANYANFVSTMSVMWGVRHMCVVPA